MARSTVRGWRSTRSLSLALPAMIVGTLAACPGPREAGREAVAPSPPVVVYSGRNESLIGPLLERFEAASGIEVRARYGETTEMAATLLEEGSNSPADVFISQDAAALGAVAAAGLLEPLPPATLARVPERFGAPDGSWVGLSGRARAIVYNTGLVDEAELPRSLDAVGNPRYRGRFGIAPANGSLQAHLAVYRALAGPPALGELLAAIADNEPATYPKNGAIVQAVIAGEIEWGLVNHYYLLRALAEDPGAPAANFFMTEGPASGFVNLAGAGWLSATPGGLALIDFLLGDEAQRYFAAETFEYPLVAGVDAAPGLVPLAELATPDVDFAQVSAALEPTLVAISASGLMR